MKAFSISELLIYNPTLKSKKIKPIEIDMQEAKIIAYYPENFAAQQKCNTVGMAEGIYQFCNSLIGEPHSEEEKRQLNFEVLEPLIKKPKDLQYIVLSAGCLIQKEVEPDTWIFLNLHFQEDKEYYRIGNKEDESYVETSFTEDLCQQIIDHIYCNFKLFYNKISGYVFKELIAELQDILNYFIPKYVEVYKTDQCLDLISYSLKDIRVIPLDVNSTLKFIYFKNVINSYDTNIKDILVFANGYLAYSSMDKYYTEFFANYLFATGDPYKFQEIKKSEKFKIVKEMPQTILKQKFGTLYNSRVLGYDENNIKQSLDRSSYGKGSQLKVANNNNQSDLLDLGSKIQLFDLYLTKNGEECCWKINFYMEKFIIFITFYESKPSFNQLIFQNRFYHDNADKFTSKISDSLNSLLKPNDAYKFLFINKSTFSGKSTIREWNTVANQIKNALQVTMKQLEGVSVTTFQNYWVYGVRRINRVLILLVPNEVPLHKIEEFTMKMTKEYFMKAYI